MPKFVRWGSLKRVELLHRVLNHRAAADVDALAAIDGVRSYEVVHIQRAMYRTRRRDRPRSEARALAAELDIMRDGDFALDLLDRLDDKRFIGRREHLVRLLAARGDWHDRWNHWRRRHGIVPDLRGANLGEIDMRHHDLRGARLQGANFGASVMRTCRLDGADLRGSKLRHTDLSYAALHGADLRQAELNTTLLTGADLSGADLRRAWLIATQLNQADLRGADLRGAVVWGVGSWDVQRDQHTREQRLLVMPGLDPIDYDAKAVLRPGWGVRVDNLEVAHFIAMLIENPKLGQIINAAAARVVLLLGRFVGAEVEVLRALEQALPAFGYVPVVFDFDEPHDRDTIETVAILAGLSNFVIANLSAPRSTPLETHLIIPAIAVPFVPIIRSSEQPFAMFTALQRKYPWVLPTVRYRSAAGLVRSLRPKVVEPAERMARRLRNAKHPRR